MEQNKFSCMVWPYRKLTLIQKDCAPVSFKLISVSELTRSTTLELIKAFIQDLEWGTIEAGYKQLLLRLSVTQGFPYRDVRCSGSGYRTTDPCILMDRRSGP